MSEEVFRDLSFMRTNFAYMPPARDLILNWKTLVERGIFRVEMPDGGVLEEAIVARLAELDLQFEDAHN
jgi:hypothetical protein